MALKMPPLFLLVGYIAMAWCIAMFMPQWHIKIPGALFICLWLVLMGGLIVSAAVVGFARAKTTMDPRSPKNTVTVVTTGIYRFSRNPMYLGFAMILTGVCIWLGNLGSFLTLPLFVLYLNHFQILPEEAHLQKKFGKTYVAYKKQVRRWL